MKPLRLAVLISGTGSNLKVVLDACARGGLAIEVVQVISNRADAGGLQHARQAGVNTAIIDRVTASECGMTQDQQVAQCLRERQPDLVLLSGYMRIVGAELVDEFAGRMINQHPSLLPRYKGLNTYSRVLAAGDQHHGASVHFVTAELDGGPVIAQVRVPVLDDDDPASLAARLAPLEHRLLLAVLEVFCSGRIQWQDGQVLVDHQRLHKPMRLDHDTLLS